MSPIRADRLNAETRKRLGIPAGRTKPSRASAGGPQRTRCHTCDQVFERYEQAERHAHAEGHVRLEIDLTGGEAW